MKVYFSDVFSVSPDVIEKYGAFNVSLINDLPLFIDPFLIFNSSSKEYQRLHKEILKYVAFLRDQSVAKNVNEGLLRSWFCFPEIKQTWLGFSKNGNGGRGPGMEFAKALNENLVGVFADFDKQAVSRSPHLEKLCLIKENIGKDNISDFVTNLIKGYLLEYTAILAKKHINPSLLKDCPVSHVEFNYGTSTWITKTYKLPVFNNDYVLLAPKDLLTKDDTWINKTDLYEKFEEIVASVPNVQLRAQLSHYFNSNLPKPQKNKKGKEIKPTKKEVANAINEVIKKNPQILDFYLKFKEDRGDEAKAISKERVHEAQEIFIDEVSKIISCLSANTDFYELSGDTLDECFKRVSFLKDVIENKDGYKIFYATGDPIKKEIYVQIMFRLTWYATVFDVSPESNSGRGPVDYKVSYGARDKTLVEFKLASNAKLKQNLQNQVEIYKKAHDTDKSIKVILFFSKQEEERAKAILTELGLLGEKYVVLIDARRDNKPSASRVK